MGVLKRLLGFIPAKWKLRGKERAISLLGTLFWQEPRQERDGAEAGPGPTFAAGACR